MCCVVFVLYTAKLIVAINFFSVLFCSVHRKLWQFHCGPVYSITSCQWKQYTKSAEMLIRNSEKVITMNWPCAEYFLRNIHVFFLAFCCNEEATKFNPYHSGLLHWHWGNHEITPVAVKQTLWILVNQSTKNDVRTYTKKKPHTTKPCVYHMGYTVFGEPYVGSHWGIIHSLFHHKSWNHIIFRWIFLKLAYFSIGLSAAWLKWLYFTRRDSGQVQNLQFLNILIPYLHHMMIFSGTSWPASWPI